ncbi:rubrerythrin family protein [Natrialbaceae archaeon GCM10025810]|uniref:rubrerythrin family protein n=1 Tax=Halovalidus salilacus TaxID=3075124 RepID=UPI0036094B13
MDAASFSADLEESMDVELDRLGSSKLLVAVTNANLEEASVLRAAAESERAAARTFEGWADDEDDDAARETFADLADLERDHNERVATALEEVDADAEEGGDADEGEGNGDPDAEGGAIHAALRSLEDTEARLGGLVGRALVSERAQLQVVNFFVNEGDERRAELFRELRADTADSRERALSALEDACESDDAWDRATAAGEEVIERAYEEYADALEGMGLDPRPIC